MKIMVAVIGTTILSMGIYALILMLILMRLNYLSQIGMGETSEGYTEINGYALMGVVLLSIGGLIMRQVKRIDW